VLKARFRKNVKNRTLKSLYFALSK
jgi:hypothetical protein